MGAIIGKEDNFSESFSIMQSDLGFELKLCDESVDLSNNSLFLKLAIADGQKQQINALLQQVPQTLAVGTLAQTYVVRFPEGLPHSLMKLHQGGYGSPILTSDGYVGTASFFPTTLSAVALGAFTAMSIVTGQYFLSRINKELKLVNQKLDTIERFLYGDKKAELLSEISFVKYAHDNFNSIMMNPSLKSATLMNLQQSRKVAMKDIEFYMSDLEALAREKSKNITELSEVADKALKIKRSMDMSCQLYVVSGLLESYYSQNYDQQYLSYLENDMQTYLGKCESNALHCLGSIQGKIGEYKTQIFDDPKVVKMRDQYVETIDSELEVYKTGKSTPLKDAVKEGFENLNRKIEYYIDKNANVYVKNDI